MRVAILGAGFAGLATTWHLLHYTQGAATIDLYDPQPIGKSVSGLSSGLLHPYAGKHAKRSWNADKGMDATHQLITEASRGVHQSVIISKGILRPATTSEQVEDFHRCAESYADTEWWPTEKCLKAVPGLNVKEGGLYIKTGLTIDVPAYLEGLWQACALLGTQFHKRPLLREQEFQKYDRVVFALGYALKTFKVFEPLPIKPVKGQVLDMRWPLGTAPLPFSIVSHGYLVQTRDPLRCMAGATFERTFQTADPEPDFAIPSILEKITPFFPTLGEAEVLSCRAGIRSTAPQHNHLPLIGKVTDKYWFITGLGSKGLLYHGWMGDLLAQALLTKDSSLFPKEVWYPLLLPTQA